MQLHPNVEAVQTALDAAGVRDSAGRPARARVLPAYPEICAAGGVPRAVFPTIYQELLRLTGAAPVDRA